MDGVVRLRGQPCPGQTAPGECPVERLFCLNVHLAGDHQEPAVTDGADLDLQGQRPCAGAGAPGGDARDWRLLWHGIDSRDICPCPDLVVSRVFPHP